MPLKIKKDISKIFLVLFHAEYEGFDIMCMYTSLDQAVHFLEDHLKRYPGEFSYSDFYTIAVMSFGVMGATTIVEYYYKGGWKSRIVQYDGHKRCLD